MMEKGQNPIIKLDFKIKGNDFNLAGEASSKVKSMLRQMGIEPEMIRKPAIALYEAEMNMVIHAEGGVVEVEITPEVMTALFIDEGPGIPDIELAMQEGYSTASDAIREMGFGAGMGLPNMKKYSDKLTIESELGKATRVQIQVLLNKR